MKKHKLQLNRTTVQTLSASDAGDVRGGQYFTGTCRSCGCVSRYCQPSLFDSCYNTDCCLEVP